MIDLSFMVRRWGRFALFTCVAVCIEDGFNESAFRNRPHEITYASLLKVDRAVTIHDPDTLG